MRVVVVGGGAAGFFAALRAREERPEVAVTILESAARPLGKVSISGGGRCNVTHACFEIGRLVQNYPRGHRQLRPVLSRWGPADTVGWFERRGVRLKTEEDGRIFPVSDDSESIVGCLLQQAERLRIKVWTRSAATGVARNGAGFLVDTRQARLECDRLLLATGSAPKGYRWVQEMGHTLVPPVPSLFTFTVPDPRLEGLAGVSLPRVVATLELSPAITQEGPLLVTHWGLSGPAILKLSAWGARELAARQYRAPLRLDLLPELDQDSVRGLLLEQKRSSRKAVKGECPLHLPRRLWCSLAAAEGIDLERPWSEVPDKALNRLSESLKRCRFEVAGKGVFKEEFVTAGGVPLDEVDLATMQSKRCPGLFLAGEILNVDGLTGGFNFQNAWATGWIAGESMAKGE